MQFLSDKTNVLLVLALKLPPWSVHKAQGDFGS